jgi:hypothetical protein
VRALISEYYSQSRFVQWAKWAAAQGPHRANVGIVIGKQLGVWLTSQFWEIDSDSNVFVSTVLIILQ